MRDKIVCLFSSKRVWMPKEYNLCWHYRTSRKDEFGIPEMKLREDKLQNIKSDPQQEQNMFLLPLNQMKQ
jgi:hypothetical protein